MGYEMMARQEAQLLWGWRPLGLLAGSWLTILTLLNWRTQEGTKEMRWLLLSSGAGVLLTLGFPPSPLIPLIFIGFVPLLIIESEVTFVFSGTARWTIFKYAFNAFFIWNILTNWWILNTSFLPGVVASLLNAIFMATVFTAWHQVRQYFTRTMQLIALVSFWIAFEYLHLFWELSWPWLNLGHAFAQYPSWVQWYSYTGIFGGSLWILLVNYGIWRLIDKWNNHYIQDRQGTIGIIVLIIAPVVTGVAMYYSYKSPEPSVTVAVVQPNYEPHYEKFNIPVSKQVDRFLRLSESVVTSETDYLVFPETSIGYINLNTIERDPYIKRLRQFVRQYPDLSLVTGLESIRRHAMKYDSIPTIRTLNGDTNPYYLDVQNSAIQIYRDEPINPYFKSKLVPGAEIFPFKEVLPFMKPLISMLDGSTEGLTKQDEREVFWADETGVAPIICYESIYGAYVGEYVRRGADLLFIVTNDGWWDKSPGHIQHLRLGALRAIEHRRSIARSANTGISCFINPRGDILQPTEYGVEAAIAGELAVVEDYTFYTRWGDIIARLAIFFTGLLIVLAIARALMPREQ